MDDRTLGERGADNSLKGKANDIKGKVKDALGGLTGNSRMQGEGKVDQLKGKAQDTLGGVQRDLDRGTRKDTL